MKARLVVFPIKGRKWCFARSVDPAAADSQAAHTPSTLRDLWNRISSNPKPLNTNAELLLDFASNKMNKAWVGLEKAPEGTLKNKLYGLGLRLLARVKPSEIFLKSISKEVSKVHVAFPSRSSLNARLVRRRLRHVALRNCYLIIRGNFIHKKYFYGSVSLLPFTFAFSVLPLPNIPFFWISFRTYSHWQALQVCMMFLDIVTNFMLMWLCWVIVNKKNASFVNNNIIAYKRHIHASELCTVHDRVIPILSFHIFSIQVLEPSEELEKLLCIGGANDGVNKNAVSDICKTFHLNKNDILKFWDSM
ncbi:hypothetical protein CK203_095068 [Vitis vinifera]|uniref:Uncharacterized protein n=1 Tax=Vitis vinifera TaxID=29760 RepID=A0A438EWK3_VITVI|nr:hypothetical protein CK203_095068 [Vitis vinifera]